MSEKLKAEDLSRLVERQRQRIREEAGLPDPDERLEESAVPGMCEAIGIDPDAWIGLSLGISQRLSEDAGVKAIKSLRSGDHVGALAALAMPVGLSLWNGLLLGMAIEARRRDSAERAAAIAGLDPEAAARTYRRYADHFRGQRDELLGIIEAGATDHEGLERIAAQMRGEDPEEGS
jgi:hypothetical protein